MCQALLSWISRGGVCLGASHLIVTTNPPYVMWMVGWIVPRVSVIVGMIVARVSVIVGTIIARVSVIVGTIVARPSVIVGRIIARVLFMDGWFNGWMGVCLGVSLVIYVGVLINPGLPCDVCTFNTTAHYRWGE